MEPAVVLVLIGTSIDAEGLRARLQRCLCDVAIGDHPPGGPSSADAGGTASGLRELIAADARFRLFPRPPSWPGAGLVSFSLRGSYGRFGQLDATLLEAANRELASRLSRHAIAALTGKGTGGEPRSCVELGGDGEEEEEASCDLARWRKAIQEECFVVLANLVDPQQRLYYL